MTTRGRTALGRTRDKPTTSGRASSASVDEEGGEHPVRTARIAAGFTQQSLADAAGVTRQTILSIEAGNYAPSVLLALRIARCCETTVEDLWGSATDEQ